MRTFEITEDRLLKLLMDEAELQALNCGGVDSWSWYGDEGMFSDLEKYDKSSYSNDQDHKEFIDSILRDFKQIK